jgi:hypothetical protein
MPSRPADDVSPGSGQPRHECPPGRAGQWRRPAVGAGEHCLRSRLGVLFPRRYGIADTVDTMTDPKAMSLRFPDPAQRAAIAAAAKQAGVSMQEYILSAAYDRATAVEQRFLEGFKASMARSGAAFAAEPSSLDPGAEQRAAEQDALREIESQERGHAA